MWADVRTFVDNPGEVLERVREQGLSSGVDAAEAEGRLERLKERLAERREAKAEHVRAFVAAKGGISEDEFAEYTADLNTQIENLQLLISSADADLDAHEEERLAAATEAWLLTLRQRLAEVEADTEEGRGQRRALVELLVEKITVSEQEDSSAEVHITYRFGEPVAEPAEGWRSEAESRKEISTDAKTPGRPARRTLDGARRLLRDRKAHPARP